MSRLLLILGAVVFFTGCVAQLKQRAAFDLDCPEDALQVTELGTNVKGVKGCGRRATYVWNNNAWIMNSPESTDAQQ